MKRPTTLMRQPLSEEPLLLPVNVRFIWLTIALAFLFNIFPWGHARGIPDLLSIVILFWGVREPRYFGMLPAFLLGLAIDVNNGALLGQHALSYLVLIFLGTLVYKRLSWFSVWQQTIYVIPLFMASSFIALLVRSLLELQWMGWSWLLSILPIVVLWPLMSWLLLIPQRRGIDHDDDRPI